MTLIGTVLKQLSTAYFVGMGLPDEEASKLHHRYYSQYGLAIRGLVRHHQIGMFLLLVHCKPCYIPNPDPLDFDRKCDGSLPLEELLKPDHVLRKLLEDVDRTKVRVWGLTNAYYTVCAVFSLRRDSCAC